MSFCEAYNNNNPMYFGNCLADSLIDLRLTELLRLKKSTDALADESSDFDVGTLVNNDSLSTSNSSDYDISSSCEDRPYRMALMAADERGFNKGDHHHYHHTSSGGAINVQHHHQVQQHPWQSWQPSGGHHHHHHMEERPSKLQTLFQISITALAFLSFGGYLLCLIVQAIKSKGTTYFHPVATSTTTTVNGGVKRIKIFRRSRRSIAYNYAILRDKL